MLPGSTVAIMNGSIGIIQNADFVNNKGRGVLVESSKVEISGSRFKHNSIFEGAAVGLESNDTSGTCDNFHFSGFLRELIKFQLDYNLKDTFLHRGSFAASRIYNCTFQDNSAANGGAVYAENVSLLLQKSYFTGNVAANPPSNDQGLGGALVSVFMSQTNISECVFVGNFAFLGGAVFSHCRSLLVLSCYFNRNEAVSGISRGGAIYAVPFLSDTLGLVVLSSTFHMNEVLGLGGAIFSSTHIYSLIQGCEFSGNNAASGGALCCPKAHVTNCTFTMNTAEVTGGVVFLQPFSTINISHCIFTNNAAQGGGAIFGGENVSFCCSFSHFYNNTAGQTTTTDYW